MLKIVLTKQSILALNYLQTYFPEFVDKEKHFSIAKTLTDKQIIKQKTMKLRSKNFFFSLLISFLRKQYLDCDDHQSPGFLLYF